MQDKRLEAIFNPKSVAVVGASRFEGKVGHVVLKNLLDFGFQGKIYPINPKADEILGLKAFPSLEEVPKVDLAIFAVKPDITVEIAENFGDKFRGAIILAGGFGEIGRKDLDERLLRASASHDFRFIGPNCMGILSATSRLAATFLDLNRISRNTFSGKSVLLSQSGATIAVLVEEISKRGGKIGHFVSYGNQLDVKEYELLEYFAYRNDVETIGVYIEGVSNGQEFYERVDKTVGKKDVIIFKVGRGLQARKAAKTHTGAIAGNYDVFVSSFEIIGAEVPKSFSQFSTRFSWLSRARNKRPEKIAVITSGGGFGVMVTDILEERGYVLQPPHEGALNFLPKRASKQNPIDLTGDASLELFLKTYRAIKDHYDLVIFIILPQLPAIDLSKADEFFRTLGPGDRIFLIPGGETAQLLRDTALSHGEFVVSTPEEVGFSLGDALG